MTFAASTFLVTKAAVGPAISKIAARAAKVRYLFFVNVGYRLRNLA